MHAFVPLMIGMRKVEEVIIYEYRDGLLTPRNAFEEYSRWTWKAVRKKNQPDSVAKDKKFATRILIQIFMPC